MMEFSKYEFKVMFEKIRSIYNRDAAEYKYRYMGERSRYYYKLEDRNFKALLDPEKKRILDLGCGTGRLTHSILKTASIIIGIDFSTNMVKESLKNKKGNEFYFVMDALNLGFKKYVFDAAVSMGMFEYVDDIGPFLEELKNVLKINAPFVFSYNNSDAIYRKLTFRRKATKNTLSADSKLNDIKNTLQKSGFKFISYHGTFFINPDFVWKYYRFFYFSFFKKIYLETIIQINLLLNKCLFFRKYCGEFIILAKRNQY